MNLDPKPGSPSVDSHSEGCPCLSFSRNFVFLLLSHLYNRIPACEIKNYNINLLCYDWVCLVFLWEVRTSTGGWILS